MCCRPRHLCRSQLPEQTERNNQWDTSYVTFHSHPHVPTVHKYSIKNEWGLTFSGAHFHPFIYRTLSIFHALSSLYNIYCNSLPLSPSPSLPLSLSHIHKHMNAVFWSMEEWTEGEEVGFGRKKEEKSRGGWIQTPGTSS